MVRVRCPVCSSAFEVSGTPPTCPTCGFAGRSGTEAPAPGWQAVDQPEGPLIVPLDSPTLEPEPRRAKGKTGMVVAVVVVLLLLVGAGTAYFLVANRGGPKTPVPVTNDELQAAVSELHNLTSPDNKAQAWGLDGNFSLPGPSGTTVTFRLKVLSDPTNKAYGRMLSGGPDAGNLSFDKRQKGTVVNYVGGNVSYLGRDENPDTLPILLRRSTATAKYFFDLNDVQINKTEVSTLRGRSVTHFVAENATAKFEFWVDNDSRHLARLRIDAPDHGYALSVLRGTEVSINVDPTITKRASFKLEKEEKHSTSTKANWTYTNGTVTQNHTEEVKLDEVELRAAEGKAENSAVRLRLKLSDKAADAPNFTLSYDDKNGDGWVSAGDTYSLRKRSNDYATQLYFYDLWANAFEGGPLPGFSPALALAALTLVAWVGLRKRTT